MQLGSTVCSARRCILTEYFDDTYARDSVNYYIVTSVDTSSNESQEWELYAIFVTGVRSVTDAIPKDYVLGQNYPNPFNPSTSLRFGLPERSRVKLSVYNLLGQLVSTLVEGVYSPGTYEVTFDQPDASGVYLYRMEATSLDRFERSVVKVGKMTFMK